MQRGELFPHRQLSRSIVLFKIDWRIANNWMGKFLARCETGTHPRASNIPAISRQLFARESARITCRCLSVFNYYRRRLHDRNIPAGCHPGRGCAGRGGRRDLISLSPREYARCRTHTARRILTAFTHYYGTFVIRYGHISHSDAFDLAREVYAFSERPLREIISII